jgi:hypothetical protein
VEYIMSLSHWRDARYDYDAIERQRRREADRDKARDQARLVRQYPDEFRPALLELLTDPITDIALAVYRELRQ